MRRLLLCLPRRAPADRYCSSRCALQFVEYPPGCRVQSARAFARSGSASRRDFGSGSRSSSRSDFGSRSRTNTGGFVSAPVCGPAGCFVGATVCGPSDGFVRAPVCGSAGGFVSAPVSGPAGCFVGAPVCDPACGFVADHGSLHGNASAGARDNEHHQFRSSTYN